MKTFSKIVFLCLISTILCSSVVNLTTSDFNETISKNKYVMVKFYAPWCSHCKRMVPEFDKLSEMVKDNGVVIADIDVTVEKQIEDEQEIAGFPTIKFFVDGQSLQYKGERIADDMYKWIKKVTETELKEVTLEEIEQLKEKQNIVVYFGTDETQKRTIELLSAVDTSVSYFYNPSKHNQTIMYPMGKEPISYPTTEELSIQKVRKWVMINSLHTVIPLSTREFLELVLYDEQSKKDVALLFKQQHDLTNETFDKFTEICEKNKDKIKCCYVDKSMDVYSGVKNYVRSKGNSVLVLTKDTLKEAYSYPHPLSEITQQSWDKFVQQTTQSKHKNLAGLQSDQLQYEHAKVLTDQNYTQFIKDHEIVFVEFYSPGCAHCVAFAEDFDAIAKTLTEDESSNIEVAAIDLKRNMESAVELKITQFPSFRLYLAGGFVDYSGNREKNQMIQFVNKTVNSKLIEAKSFDQVPTPAIVLYDSAQKSALRFLPAIFNRFPVYHIKEGDKVKIVLKMQEQKTYPADGQLNLQTISNWLFKESEPVLVDLLVPNMEGKLRNAIQTQIHLLGMIDIQPEHSQKLTKAMEGYCKTSDLVCGYAKKGNDHFEDLMAWAGVDKDIKTSQVIYVNTKTYEKYLLPSNIGDIDAQIIGKFVQQVKEGKLKSIGVQQGQRIAKAKEQEDKKEGKKTDEQENKRTEEQEQTSQDSQQSDKAEKNANQQEL